jgi:proteasome lid subunit RPN8/RPN11
VLRLTPQAVAGLRRACAAAAPKEACGVLLGLCMGDDVLAEDVIVARGAAAQGAFEISDHELRRMAACAEGRGLGVVAIFHSHPSGTPDLSATDRAMLRWSRWDWVVVAGVGPAVTLAAYAAGVARPIALKIAERPGENSTTALAARLIHPAI